MPLQKRTKKKKSRAGTGTIYSAKDIKELFFAETSSRQAQNVSNDGTYWTGGHCQWGGSHNLDEDAQTLAKFLNKIGELDNAKVELMDCADRNEFSLTKQKLITQCDEAVNGLQAKTGYGTSIGGICIIWGDFTEFLENTILSRFRREFSRLKSEISECQFEEAKELAILDIEQAKVEQEMIENAQKAEEFKDDPVQQAIFLELIEENKKKLHEITDKKKRNRVNNLGNDFNIDNYITELLKSTKSDSSNPSNHNNQNKPPTNTTNPNTNKPSPETSPQIPNTPTDKPTDFFQENKRLILFATISLLAIFYLYSQKDDEEEYQQVIRKGKGKIICEENE